MRKFIIFALVMVMLMSLCACGNSKPETVVIDGEIYPIREGETLTIDDGEFVVTKITMFYKASSISPCYEYWATLASENNSILVQIDAGYYAAWNIGDVINGKIVKQHGSNETFEVNGENFYIKEIKNS